MSRVVALETSERVLVLQLHTARRKARQAAEAEVTTLLEDLGARRLPGGPLAEGSRNRLGAVNPTRFRSCARV